MEMAMLPRIAMPVTVPVPSPQEQVSTAASGPGRLLAPEALANLRAAVLLRLLEAMMRQIERSGDGNDTALQLLGVLFEAMKELPARNGRDDEASRRLSNLLSRLPPELRPRMERLLAAAFSTAPTRVLMEIIRNPGGPDARQLAQTLLAAAGEMAEGEQPPSKRNHDLSASGARLPATWRNEGRDLPSGAANGASGDGRALQAALRRLFGGGADLHPGRVGQDGGSATAAPAAPLRKAGEAAAERANADARANERQGEGARTASTFRSGVSSTGFDDESLAPDAPQSAWRGAATVARPASRRFHRNRKAALRCRSGAAAAARGESRAGHDGMLRLMAKIVANLTEDDALILRLLLQAPLPDPAAADASNQSQLPGSDETTDARRTGVGLRAGEAKGSGPPADPAAMTPTESDAETASTAAASRPKDNAETLPKPKAPGDEPPVRAAANAAVLPDRPAERPPVPLVGREGLPVPFVPYPPPLDGLDTRKDAGRDEPDEEMPDAAGEDEDEGQDAQDGEGDEPSQEETDADPAGRTADEHADPPDPGFAFYRTLGDDWT